KLSNDTLKPLFNRASMATYPPGSTFKVVNALIGLQERVLFPNTKYSCNGPETKPIGCSHHHKSPLILIESIEQSCNPYYWNVFKTIIDNPSYKTTQEGFNAWRDHVLSLGFGKNLDNDIINQKNGNVPKDKYYDKYFGKGIWKSLTIRSLSIGQGELLVTPLQLANFVAIVANKGFYYSPHLVRSIDSKDNYIEKYKEKKKTSINSKYFNVVIEGMSRVFKGEHGTARWHKIDSIPACGKTGTVQNPHGKDHSIFIAFAPIDNPEIAICVVVENSGFGSTWAAPMATLMIEKYLKAYVKRKWIEERMLNANFISGN
ncbi:MAG: penicillin-binding protein 2, partial [Bacteroidales bacterium]|nr:penicillin-binding protein 2 [Bacteroidales bacterium]